MPDKHAKGLKQTSDRLVGLNGKDDVLRFLSQAGFDVRAAAKRLLGDTETTGALLVGSVAEGYQTASSDIDILFLTYSGREEVDTSSRLLIESGSSLELLTYADGVEVNTEIICREDYESLADLLDQMAGTVAMGGQLKKLPMIDNYSLRFLHRLRTGVVLYGEDVIEEFRADFHVRALPLYLSIKYLILARESLEDARTSSPETYGLVEFICRDVLEHCLLALAAAEGFTSQSRRFVMNWIAALPDGAEHGEALRAIRSALLNRAVLSPGEKSRLIDECARHYAYVVEALRSDPIRRRILDQIFSTISYAE
ncbi:MAG: hypothetical protein IRZ07_01590 [Microbispora sp.]|nr:hypothetical protein [Microbispora sp.]